MGDIVAPEGSPLAQAILSVSSMPAALAFYRDALGLTEIESKDSLDADFCEHWRAAASTGGSWSVLQGGPDAVGQIVLVDFGGQDRVVIREAGGSRGLGLFNLNFYTSDIQASTRDFKARGFEFWSDPVQHQFGPDVGSPIEVVFEGPDNIPINLVELATRDPTTRIGQMRAYVERYGRTETGYTPVVTTSHGVADRAAAIHFYRDVLAMEPLIDEEMSSPDANRFLRLDEQARTHVTFMQGNHMFGKVVLAEPLNYECESLVDRAVAPNVGYLAQSFEVSDIDEAAWACARTGAEVYSPVRDVIVPGRGVRPATIVRNPGSGALQQLFQTSS